MKYTWKNVTVKQFLEMRDKSQEEIMDILFGDIPITQLKTMEFDLGDIPVELPKVEYVVNNKTFVFEMDIRNFTTAQYMDFTQSKDMLTQLSVVLLPLGTKYEGNIQYDLNDLSIVDALSVLNFFVLSWQTSVKAMKKYLQKHKMNLQMEQLEALDNLVSSVSLGQ